MTIIPRKALGLNGTGAGVGMGGGVAEAVMPHVAGRGVSGAGGCCAVSASAEAEVAINAAGRTVVTRAFAIFFISAEQSYPIAESFHGDIGIERCGGRSRRERRSCGSSHATRDGTVGFGIGQGLRGECERGCGGRDQGRRPDGRHEGFCDIFHRRKPSMVNGP